MENDAENLLNRVIEKFHARLEEDPELKESVKELKKEIRVVFTDDGSWGLTLSSGRISNLRRTAEEGDIKVITDVETLRRIMEKEMNPLVAYVRGRIKVKGSLEDLAALKSLLR